MRIERDQGSSYSCFVIPILDMFDVIYQSHSVKLGQLGEDRTYTDVTKNYYGVSHTIVQLFIIQ